MNIDFIMFNDILLDVRVVDFLMDLYYKVNYRYFLYAFHNTRINQTTPCIYYYKI